VSESFGTLPGNAKGAAVGLGGVVLACDDGSLCVMRRAQSGWQLEILEKFPSPLARVSARQGRALVCANDGRLRPDALVRLPGGKSVVIDAKTPLDAYLTALESTDPAVQAQALADHARQLKTQVKLLGGKDYWAALPEAPDFVVMFVPGEAFYSAAMEQDPTIFETALEAKVLVCSPTTLIALVKSIAYGWQQEKLAENAEKVARDARTLYERLAKFGEHMDGVGRGLRQAVGRYNEAVGSLEMRVIPSARAFKEAGVVGDGVEIPAPRQVEIEPRILQAPELAPPEPEPDPESSERPRPSEPGSDRADQP